MSLHFYPTPETPYSGTMWIETYRICGCSTEADSREELLGYCAKHGSIWQERYKLTYERRDKEGAAPDGEPATENET